MWRETVRCSASMSSTVTPGSSPHWASMSRGTARSTSSSGRPRRAAMTSPISSAPSSVCGEAVEAITMSARSSSPGSASKEPEAPPKRWASAIARSRRRLATNIVVTPWSCSAWAVSSAVSPAPTITTWRSARSPSASRAASTATEATEARPTEIAVSVRTRLPVASAARKSLLVIGPVVRARERELVRALDLALDLGLADDHRLEAARDPVQVARGVAVAQRVHAADAARSAGSPARRASSPSTCDSASTGSETTR